MQNIIQKGKIRYTKRCSCRQIILSQGGQKCFLLVRPQPNRSIKNPMALYKVFKAIGLCTFVIHSRCRTNKHTLWCMRFHDWILKISHLYTLQSLASWAEIASKQLILQPSCGLVCNILIISQFTISRGNGEISSKMVIFVEIMYRKNHMLYILLHIR